MTDDYTPGDTPEPEDDYTPGDTPEPEEGTELLCHGLYGMPFVAYRHDDAMSDRRRWWTNPTETWPLPMTWDDLLEKVSVIQVPQPHSVFIRAEESPTMRLVKRQ